MKKLNIAIDERPLTGADAVRGIGFHTKELVAALKALAAKSKDCNIHVVDFSRADLSSYDLVHYQSFHPHFLTLPFFKPAKNAVLTIHDLIRLVYPNEYPPGIKGKLKFSLQKFNLRNFDAFITISEASKNDIMKFLDINPDKIFPIYLAPQTRKILNISKAKLAETAKKLNLPKKFILYVGDVNYNKNLHILAAGCKKAGLSLVIVGKQAVIESVTEHPENRSWRTFLDKYKNDKSVIRLGFLQDEDFESVFKLAALYCQPSLYEGFGLPLLEAFERNIPVVAADTPALKEVGGQAAIYFDPYDSDDLAKKVSQLVRSEKLRIDLVKKGSARVKNFSWDKTAEQTLEVYRKVCGR